ncbi:MAG: VapC toxin family PIN domain ribonuclease [Balneola sp.]|nr:VapC toxin family PIN domain ribonuclease [Balneola sp.]|tara:strand:- start:34014 stop:34448 length:435 start_codon:yes stop_codon:yes gene_type:complete
MKVLFDSSALIAAFVESHPKHNEARKWLSRAKRKEIEYVVAGHSLFEVYSVLTSAPFQPRITPGIAQELLKENVEDHAQIITLSKKDHHRIIQKLAEQNLKGGIVYDAIIAECAIKAKADQMITSNSKDFVRIFPEDSIQIVSL